MYQCLKCPSLYAKLCNQTKIFQFLRQLFANKMLGLDSHFRHKNQANIKKRKKPKNHYIYIKMFEVTLYQPFLLANS